MYQRIQAVLLIARGYSVDDVARITGSHGARSITGYSVTSGAIA